MPFDAKINFDGSPERRVLHTSYSVSQSADYVTGKTTSEVYAGNITLEVESANKSKFWEYAIHPTKRFKGEIIFKSDEDEEKTFKTVSFEDAAVIAYSESLDARSTGTTTENVTLSVKKLIVDDVSFEKKW